MPNISDIMNEAAYTGSKELGGFANDVISPDIRPIEQLAQYTFLYNKSLFDQRQKDADEKIKQLAALTAYDLANGRGKDKQAVIDNQAKLHDWMAQFAAKGTPKSPKEKIQQDLEFQTKIQDSLKLINSANERNIGYQAKKDGINADASLSAAQKDNLIKDLDKEFDDTDIYTPISPLPKFDLTVPPVAPPVYKTTGVLIVTPNGVVDQEVKLFDPKTNMNAAFLQANDLEAPTLPANATELQKQEFRQKSLGKSPNKIWQDAAQVYNTAIADPRYQKVNPDGSTYLDYDAIKSNNPILNNTLSLIDRYNNYSAERKADAQAGFYTDKVGNRIKLLQTVNPDDFFTIDKTQPLSPAQVVFLQKFAAASPDTKLEKYQYTGDATKLTEKRLEESGANYRAGLHAKGPKSETVIDKPAILFGQHIQRLKTTFANNGGQDIKVPYEKVDEKTRIAAKMDQGESIEYKPDGSFDIIDKKGAVKSIGTIENLAQGFIDAVKVVDLAGGAAKDGTMAEGFQTKSESKFNELFGTTSGKVIWDNWGAAKPTTQPAAPPKESEGTTININDVPAGTKLEKRKGKYYYKSKEVLIQ